MVKRYEAVQCECAPPMHKSIMTPFAWCDIVAECKPMAHVGKAGEYGHHGRTPLL